MREFEFNFDDGLLKGLRRFKTNPRNAQTLVECHNWMPAEQGLELHEEIVLIGTEANFFLLMNTGDHILLNTGNRIII